MVIHTETPAVDRSRRLTLELLIADHPSDCLTCVSDQRCELQKVAAYIGINKLRIPRNDRHYPIDDSNPFFSLDRNKCILCARCTRTCNEITCVGAIDLANRGYSTKVAAAGDSRLLDSICQSCGECMVRCPTGALSPKAYLPPAEEYATTCTYCGTGCGMILGVRGGKVVSVRGNEKGTNRGNLCVKGRFGISEYIHHPDRLTTPLIKKNGKLEKASWDEALELIVENFKKYSPDEMAVIPSSRSSNEDVYAAQKFGRAVLGTNHIDNCARV
jgi:predicted molibdopterin-dependent oxidoreductase YjgC